MSDPAELQQQITTYRKLIDKEKEEIKQIRAQIQKKNESMHKSSSTPAAGSNTTGNNAQMAWEDNGSSSGKKFKFIHIILVAIVFLLLGNYLAKVPMPARPASTVTSETKEPTDKETASASQEKTIKS